MLCFSATWNMCTAIHNRHRFRDETYRVVLPSFFPTPSVNAGMQWSQSRVLPHGRPFLSPLFLIISDVLAPASVDSDMVPTPVFPCGERVAVGSTGMVHLRTVALQGLSLPRRHIHRLCLCLWPCLCLCLCLCLWERSSCGAQFGYLSRNRGNGTLCGPSFRMGSGYRNSCLFGVLCLAIVPV